MSEKETLSVNKYHPIYGRILGVALEATFYVTELLTAPKEYSGLIYNELTYGQARVYYPAIAEGDVKKTETGKITFSGWFDRTLAAYHRIQLRLRPAQKGSRVLPWVRLARLGEEKVFGFEFVSGAEQAYLPLDFFSKRAGMFLPLFVKAKEGPDTVYLVIEAKAEENTPDAVVLRTRRITPSEAPRHLVQT